jgi:hypothetical protein
MSAVLEAILEFLTSWGGIAVVTAISWSLMSAAQRNQVVSSVSNVIRGAIFGATSLLADVEGQLHPIVVAFANAIRTGATPITDVLFNDFKGLTINAFNTIEKVVSAQGESTPQNAVNTAGLALAESYAFGLSSFAVTAAYEALFPEKLNVLNGTGAMLSSLAGFDDVSGAIREPLFKNAFGKSAEYYYRSVFKPELPDEFDAVLWHGRGLLSDAQLTAIFNYSGLKTEYENAFIQSGYRAVQPRAIATAIQDTPFPTAEMQSLLKFNGYRDQDVALMLTAFEGASTRNVRNQYLSALVTAAERGTITAADLDSSLTSLNFSAAAKGFVQLTVATRKLEQLAEIYRKSVSEAYKYGLITDAEYVPHLAAIGIAQADADAHYAVDSIAKQGKAAAAAVKAAERAAAKLEATTVRAALAEYHVGNIDAAALLAGLLAAGLDPALAALAVAIAGARLQGAQVLVFGQLMSRPAAQLLREQVAALEKQFMQLLIDDATVQAQLLALGISQQEVTVLMARWGAGRGRTAKAPELLPV